MLENIQQPEFDFTGLDYLNITDKVKSNSACNLMYAISNVCHLSEEMLELMNLKRDVKTIQEQLNRVV